MLDFWRIRKKLWSNTWDTKGPLVRSDDASDLDRLVSNILRQRRLTSATRHLPAGLADDPWHHTLRDVFGHRFAPFREVRTVWIPTAVHFATYEGRRQDERLALFEKDGKPFDDYIEEMKANLAKFEKPEIYDILRAWGTTPVDRFLSHDRVLEQIIGSILDHCKKIHEEIALLADYTRYATDLTHHRTIDYHGRAMVTVLAMGWARLTDKNDIKSKAFADFVAYACYAAGAKQPTAAAIATIRASKTDWLAISTLPSLLRITEDVWDDICKTAPVEYEPHLSSGIYDVIMIPDDLKQETWNLQHGIETSTAISDPTGAGYEHEGRDDDRSIASDR